MVSQWTRESNSKFDICRRGILRPESRRRGGGLVRFPAANASIATKSPLKPRRSPQNDALSPRKPANEPSKPTTSMAPIILLLPNAARFSAHHGRNWTWLGSGYRLHRARLGIYFIPLDGMQEIIANEAISTLRSTVI